MKRVSSLRRMEKKFKALLTPDLLCSRCGTFTATKRETPEKIQRMAYDFTRAIFESVQLVYVDTGPNVLVGVLKSW